MSIFLNFPDIRFASNFKSFDRYHTNHVQGYHPLSVSNCFLGRTLAVLLTKGSAANYIEGFTNFLATKKKKVIIRELIATLHTLLLVYCRILLPWKKLLTLK